MTNHKVVSADEWVKARKELLAKEKEFTRLRDELSRQRQALPWEKVEKEYTFDGPNGQETLADLFEGRSQLIVYHFMFDPQWDEGCKSCSLLADYYNPSVIHLKQRDTTMVAVSRAPLSKLDAFKKRMGWSFKWVSSFETDFNWDFHVSFTPEQVAGKEKMHYNYSEGSFPSTEGPGISVFFKDGEGDIYHTYSSFARGLDMFLGVYHLLDIVPKGRDEQDLDYGMAWVRHHDNYGDPSGKRSYVELQPARKAGNGR